MYISYINQWSPLSGKFHSLSLHLEFTTEVNYIFNFNKVLQVIREDCEWVRKGMIISKKGQSFGEKNEHFSEE